MNGVYLRFAVAWLVSIGIGCASAPVHYYTLTAMPGMTSAASEPTLAIDVRIVHTPPQLDRTELMVRTGPAEVTLLENERWASPVSDEIRYALRLELQRRLGRTSGLRPALAGVRVDVDVQHLEAELGQYALFEASWSATLSATGQGSTGARVTTCTFRADEKIQTGYSGMVEGYQREIAALADAIGAVLTSPAGGIDAPCQRSAGSSGGVPGAKGR